MHGMHAADVDDDGRDEVVIGSAVIDDNGKPLWNTAARAIRTSATWRTSIPARPGLEIFYGIEPGRQSNTVCLVEAKTGKTALGQPGDHRARPRPGHGGRHHPGAPGHGMLRRRGQGRQQLLALHRQRQAALATRASASCRPRPSSGWTARPRCSSSGKTIYRWPREKVGEIEGRIVAIADCLGDWREEIITALDGEIRIYTTTVPATTRRVCLMQDRLYRTDVAMQTMGYFYPPQLGGTPLKP